MRKVIFVFVLAALLTAPVSAQMITSDVLNIANLTQLIAQVYATYDNIMATIEQVQNTYQQLEKQAKMLMSMPEKLEKIGKDIKESNENGPSLEAFLKFREQYADIVKYLNDSIQLTTNIYDTFTKKEISFGGQKYTFGGLFGVKGRNGKEYPSVFQLPINMVQFAHESAKEAAAGYAGKLTQEERNAIMAKYGMSPENFYKLRLVERSVALPLDDFIASGLDEANELRRKVRFEEYQYIQELKEIAGDSMVSQMEINTDAILNLGKDMENIGQSIKEIIRMTASFRLEELSRNEIEAENRAERIRMERVNEVLRRQWANELNGY